MKSVMKEVAQRGSFCRKFGVRYVDLEWPYLEIRHPAGVARLIGEAKRLHGEGRVFLRGQVDHHRKMLPSLFRNSDADPQVLLAAEAEFANRVSQEIPARRFRGIELPALLQHYGFRTSWLDAVDNIFIASWFATTELRTLSNSSTEVINFTREYAWLFLIATKVGSNELNNLDLRLMSHPLSTRPHVQHGISLRPFNSTGQDLRDFVIGTVRFPVGNYTTTGALFAGTFLFPGPEVDHTLRLLVKHQIDDLAAEVEKNNKLSEGSLGRTLRVQTEIFRSSQLSEPR